MSSEIRAQGSTLTIVSVPKEDATDGTGRWSETRKVCVGSSSACPQPSPEGTRARRPTWGGGEINYKERENQAKMNEQSDQQKTPL